MSPIDESLFTFLNQIKGSGTFLMQNKVEQIIPGLEIKGMGPVSFPLTAHSIQPLIEVAHQAPFGKGADTLVDTSVRNTWEIDGDQLVFHNPVWEATLKRMLRKVKKELGLKDKEIRADLYKLLIYEKDGFFLPHKDSEKAPGMFGTLIIGLPADHEGGQLQVSFGGKEEVVDFSGPVREFQMPYTAFYADCLHEIKPVTAGYRVCLIYNLIQEKGEKIRGITTTSGYVEGLRDILQEAAAAADTFPKIVMLNHAYTPENFSRAALKLDDAPRVEALETAAEQAGFESRLALLSHYEYGSWEDDYAYYGGSKKGGDTPEMEELFEAETSYEFWEGSAPGLGDMDPSKGVYIGASEPGEGKPSEYETEGYTGNAGMTVEYWYHYGAVVLWPKKWTPHMLQNAKNETQVEWLQYWLRFEPQSPERMHARTLLEQLTTAEVVETVEYKVSTLTPIIEGAIELNHQRFLQRFNWTNHFAAVDPDIWPELSEWLTPETMLSTFRQKGENGTFADFILITQTLLAGFEETYDSFLPIQHQIMQALPDFLHRFELGKPPASIYHWQADSERKTFEEQLESLLPLVVRLEQYAA
ncbi:MAG: 2OG-Fe(II) oxygenase, partial [Bacteroidota bacterium]